MKLTNIYTKRFSKILNLQKEEEILYCIAQEESDGPYGIVIKNITSDVESNILNSQFESKEDALKYLCFFYENSIRPEEAGDIAEDLKCINA